MRKVPIDRRTIAKALLELFVVFFGVYSAFLLDRYQDRVQERHSAELLYAFLIGEVESVAIGLDRQRVAFDQYYYEPHVINPAAGQPLLPYYQVNVDHRADELQALLTVSNVNSAELLFTIRYFNLTMSHYGKVSDELRRLSTDQLAPALGDPAAFHDSSGGLRAEFSWYPVMVKALRGSMTEAVASAERLAGLLEKLGVAGEMREGTSAG